MLRLWEMFYTLVYFNGEPWILYMSILKFGLNASTKKSEFNHKYNEKYPIVIVRPQGPK